MGELGKLNVTSNDEKSLNEMKNELKNNSLKGITVRFSHFSGRIYIDFNGTQIGYVLIQ